ncbi:acyl-CoA dehydrogenase family protein [Cupriavidus basilensis]|uniref:Acyl-CoA dehydrogenase family protein n=1 Tax=Cupriavidus basilensis TaxID=68895 RepID=A0ABT6AVG7_9BURK|nr:acyl-CoA dehydrogenase family protein [Cupriavidus basilensis]MDF3836618.1 acyl-CoA dehydrogenase family protein [Cupriavidus basilensis]
MDFSTSPRHRDIARRMAALGRDLQDPGLAERDRQGRFSRELWSTLARQRVHALTVAPEHGGEGFGALDLVFALEALAEHCEDTGLLFALAAHLCACLHPLARFGDPALQQRWLPAIVQEGQIGAHAITEAGAGSDINAMRCTATRDGDGYRLHGEKRYITNAPVCDFIVVHARTGAGKGFLDYSAFVLDSRTPGVQLSHKPHEKVGLRTTAMGDIRFDGAWVHASQRLGAEGNGGPIFQASMAWERSCLFAIYLGAMRRQLRRTCQHAETRVQFGQPLIAHQAIAHRIADMHVRLESARLACLKAAWELDHAQSGQDTPAMAKLLVSEASIRNGLDALHIHGASGVLEGDVERQLRNALPSTLFSGGNEVLKDQLLRQLRRELRHGTGQAR